jgi:hypothetical protein
VDSLEGSLMIVTATPQLMIARSTDSGKSLPART